MARNGQHTGGKPALGYQVVDGRLAIQPEEAEIVRRIFQEYADGRSYREIIAGLNSDGLKTKRGNAFGNNSLHDLLKNEKYIGVLVYGAVPYREDGTRNSHAAPSENTIRIEDALPPIISKELFYQVQGRMSANRRQQAGRPPKNRDYPLKGKVFCASCGAAMSVGISKGGYYYYKCTGKKRLHNCDASPIRVDKLEKLAVQYTRAMLGSPTNVDKLLQILREQAQTIQGGAAARLNALIAEEREVTAKLNNAVDTLLEGFASTALKNKITDLEAQKAKLENDIKQLKNQVDMSMLQIVTVTGQQGRNFGPVRAIMPGQVRTRFPASYRTFAYNEFTSFSEEEFITGGSNMDYKRVLALHFTNGMSSREIAETTGDGKTTINECCILRC